MYLDVLDAGLLTTVQDLGRMGYQRLGISPSGAMDPFAIRAANALVGNDEGAAALEITLIGPRLVFSDPCIVAVTGADLGPTLDGHPVPCWVSIVATAGSVLGFSGSRSGARAYLGVSGGVSVEPWLGSASTYMVARVGGYRGRALLEGDRIPVGPLHPSMVVAAGASVPFERRPPYSDEPVVRVIWGPHADRFTETGRQTFLSGRYLVTRNSDRMGYRLEGPRIEHSRGPDLISCGIPMGGIQVPGNGQPIILMADHQTTGGYTMIATVIQADIPLVSYCLPDSRIRFKPVSLEEAREALQRQRRGIRSSIEAREASLWEVA